MRSVDLPELRERDCRAVLALARARILRYDQLRTLVYTNCHASVVSRRVRALEAAGWLRRWRPLVPRGGAASYATLTQHGMTAALAELASKAALASHARLLDAMLPTGTRKPLLLPSRIAPAFLAHQLEVNQLLVAYERATRLDLRWASSWDRPFGATQSAFVLPQPDYVLVLARPGGALLVFGEHDRGSESLVHFRSAKVDRYAAFALLPDLAQQLFGIPIAEVWVTVSDPVRQNPRRRLRHLVQTVRGTAAAPIVRFALAGSVYASPSDPPWETADSIRS